MAGTYTWTCSYTGDGNNNAASRQGRRGGADGGQPGQPDDHHDPQPDRVTLGTTSVTLKDTAVLSGGYSARPGTITFTLYDGSKLVDTETVTVSGNGSYTTPTGYTLPTTGTVTGTYQWDATYNGDPNNGAGLGQQRREGAGDGEPGQPDDRDHGGWDGRAGRLHEADRLGDGVRRL